MPELAEVRLTSDFVNKVSSGKIFHSVWKNPVHKGQPFQIDYPFEILAQSRGKEMMLEISESSLFHDKNQTPRVQILMMTMGMGGHFEWAESGNRIKHTHLSFLSDSGELAFVDIRRFGKWKFGFWNPDRGPDPTNEFDVFKRNVFVNMESKDFRKPIHELLMNQKYFNGIGNYLRAEILFRTNCNPFISGKEAIENFPEILDLCKDLPLIAYQLGGGRLKDWKNPYGESTPDTWQKFMLCYGNKSMSKILDKNGRTFWYDPKWNNL
jgi:endonuclease VIII-like 1